MIRMELILCSLSEETAIQLHQERESQGFPALKRDAALAGQTAGKARKVVEQRIGKAVVSSENFLESPGAGKSVNHGARTRRESRRSAELPQSTLFDGGPPKA